MGVLALSCHLAVELVPDRVRVNCLAPHAVNNGRIRTYTTDEQRGQMAANFPPRRIGRPDDIAAIRLLASQASSWITGITLDIAGWDTYQR